jgi:hypothetical protein
VGVRSATTDAVMSHDQPSESVPAARRRRHTLRWVLAGIAVAVLTVADIFAYLWSRSGAHAVPSSEAIERFRH